ncbi:hypothetical protein ACRAKI_05255 [Saccharothrix isguenensis]
MLGEQAAQPTLFQPDLDLGSRVKPAVVVFASDVVDRQLVEHHHSGFAGEPRAG